MSSKYYDPNFKVKVVLESLNSNTTLEAVKAKYKLSNNALNNWRKIFFSNAHIIFSNNKPNKNDSYDVDQLKKLIGDLTIQNEILKKVSSLMN